MAVKIYKPADSFVVVVDKTDDGINSVAEKTYTTSTHTKFGFDGDNCWVEDLLTGLFILKEPVTNIQNLAGDLTQTKAGVETYLLTFIGG